MQLGGQAVVALWRKANNLGVEKVLDACVWDRVGWIRKRQG